MSGDLRAVVFDCDGLLLDTETAWTVAERAVTERWGGAWSMAFKERHLLGVAVPDAAAAIARHAGAAEDEAPAIATALDGAFRDVVAQAGCAPMPGAAALVDALADAGVALAVASNTRREMVELVLERSGLPRRFSAVVCAGPGVRAKPAPDVYVAACRALGVDGRSAAALEDSQTGVDAARAAGMRVAGVPSAGAPLAADRVFGSLADVTPRDLAELVAA